MSPILSSGDSQARINLVNLSGLPFFCSGPLLVLQAYFDESGSSLDRRPILVLGGYVADAEQWVSFSGRWKEVLEKYKVSHFHATELPSRHSKLYRHLSVGQKKAFVDELVTVIGDHVDLGVSIIMCPDDWRFATTDTFRCKYGSAYGVCMELLLMLTSVMLRRPGREPERVSVFLEDGHKNAGDAILRALNYKSDTEPVEVPPGAKVSDWLADLPRTDFMRIGGVGLFPKITTIPLQAADLFCYLVSNLFRPTSHFVFEKSLCKLAGAKPHWYSAWNAPKVNNLVRLIELGKELGAEEKERIWRLCGALRALGFKTQTLQGGLAVDAQGKKILISEDEWEQLFEVHGLPAPKIK